MKLNQSFHALLIFSVFLVLGGCQKSPTADDLLSHTPSIREQAFKKLAKESTGKKKSLVPGMILGLRDNDPQINQRALDALVIISTPAVSALTTALQDTDPYVKAGCADSLGKIGPPAAPAIEALTKLLQDPHPLVVEEAQIALDKIKQK